MKRSSVSRRAKLDIFMKNGSRAPDKLSFRKVDEEIKTSTQEFVVLRTVAYLEGGRWLTRANYGGGEGKCGDVRYQRYCPSGIANVSTVLWNLTAV